MISLWILRFLKSEDSCCYYKTSNIWKNHLSKREWLCKGRGSFHAMEASKWNVETRGSARHHSCSSPVQIFTAPCSQPWRLTVIEPWVFWSSLGFCNGLPCQKTQGSEYRACILLVLYLTLFLELLYSLTRSSRNVKVFHQNIFFIFSINLFQALKTYKPVLLGSRHSIAFHGLPLLCPRFCKP